MSSSRSIANQHSVPPSVEKEILCQVNYIVSTQNRSYLRVIFTQSRSEPYSLHYSIPSYIVALGRLEGSAEDLLRDVDSWAHSTGRWVSDTRVRLWNRTRVIPGHLHTYSINSYRLQLPFMSSSTSSLHSFLVCPSILALCFFSSFFPLLKSLILF